MKKTMKTLTSAALSALALLTATPFANAGSEHLLIQGNLIAMGDQAGRLTFTRTFTLPSNVVTSNTSTANAGWLQMTIKGVLFGENSVYINPPTTSCLGKSRDVAAGGNASALVHKLSSHGSDDSGETFTEHKFVDASRLRPGTNTLMICARNATGELTGEIDDFTFGTVALYFKTTP